MHSLSNFKSHKDIHKVVEKWGAQAEMLSMSPDWLCFNSKEATAVVFQNPIIDPLCVFFGYMSFPDDIQNASVLFTAIEEWASEKKIYKIIGPVNYATWVDYRWMISGWEHPPVVPEIVNPKHMPVIAEKLGYSICHTYSSALVKADDSELNIYEDRFEKLKKEGFLFETHVGKECLFAINDMFEISKSFSKNPYYSPVPYDIFKNSYAKSLLKEDAVMDVCIKNGELCGYCVNYINKPFKSWWVFKSIAIRPEHQGKNIGSALRYLFHKHGIEAGCSGVVHHYRFDGNISMKLAKGGDIIKRYALFGKNISQ